MYLRNVATSLSRRWYLTMIGLLVTACLSYLAMSLVPPSYEAKANVLLLPPASTVDNGGNPYLQLTNLDRVVDVLTRSLNSQSTVEKLSKAYPDGEYEVTRDFATSGPIIVITATAKTPELALSILHDVTDLAAPTMTKLQDLVDVPAKSQITTSVLTSQGRPDKVQKAQLRALIATVAVGLLGSAMIIAILDSFLLGRKKRQEAVNSSSGETIEPTTVVEIRDSGRTQPQEAANRRSRRLVPRDQSPTDEEERSRDKTRSRRSR